MSMSTATTVPDTQGVPFPANRLLPCEFVGYHHCDEYFDPDDVEGWIEHIVTEHLDNHLPKKVICWYCDNFVFDYKATGDRRYNFECRMWHIRGHIVEEGLTVHHMRPDHYLNAHLNDHRLIPENTYQLVRRRAELPQPGWIYSHDALPPELEEKRSRDQRQYAPSPRDEERKHRKEHRHRSGKGWIDGRGRLSLNLVRLLGRADACRLLVASKVGMEIALSHARGRHSRPSPEPHINRNDVSSGEVVTSNVEQAVFGQSVGPIVGPKRDEMDASLVLLEIISLSSPAFLFRGCRRLYVFSPVDFSWVGVVFLLVAV
ncbi:hypothetical protein NUW58_g4806 [Xylaria curta]|uniref:Uncharacterized protein n=1 Tax=Xylaria curta TaxID=42375 RepID=A0ACC1P635_9PEZI|nr:hypothetical protein NUW58_g4806 [Xylaria curta]